MYFNQNKNDLSKFVTIFKDNKLCNARLIYSEYINLIQAYLMGKRNKSLKGKRYNSHRIERKLIAYVLSPYTRFPFT